MSWFNCVDKVLRILWMEIFCGTSSPLVVWFKYFLTYSYVDWNYW